MALAQRTFRVHAECYFFKSEGDADGPQRIGGLVSTDSVDRQGERIIQKGLDFGPFLEYGFLNADHTPGIAHIVGYPDSVCYVEKGCTLPDGSLAKANGHWMEGTMLDDEHSLTVYRKAMALLRTGGKRRPAYSIEGAIIEREAMRPKTVAKAQVKHVAITHIPVNQDCGMVALAKALTEAGGSDHEPQFQEVLPEVLPEVLARAESIASPQLNLLQGDFVAATLRTIRPRWPERTIQVFSSEILRLAQAQAQSRAAQEGFAR